MTVDIRRLEPDDWRLWREVRLEALAEAPYAFGSTLEYWSGEGDTEENWRSRLLNVPLNIVALSGGRGVGQVGATAPDGIGRVEMISMWVAPDVRGAGVGDALIAEVVRWAADQRAAAVELAVKRSNGPGIQLYRRHGFALSEERAEADDEQLMLLRLGPSDAATAPPSRPQ